MSIVRRLLSLLILIGIVTVAPAAAQNVARVTNTARLSWSGASGARTVASNSVTLDVDRAKGPTSLSFRLLPVDFALTGVNCQPGDINMVTAAKIDAADLVGAPRLAALDVTHAIVFVFDNQTGNLDPRVREEAIIDANAGSTHNHVRLFETSENSGIFAGGLPPQTKFVSKDSCSLDLQRGAMLKLSFEEDAHSYASTNSILIDPVGVVFDSQTGALVDGATVSLFDERGQLAEVYGDDGVSRYPSVVITGSSATDASGRFYQFSQGNYRFPLTAPGRYYLHVAPPDRYTAPSTRDRAAIAALRDPEGKPFVLNEASYGGVFALTSPEPFMADIPIDRDGDTKLLLTKTASVREASAGDFVQYRITLENRSDVVARNIHLTDILPDGLRYERGSQRGSDPPTVSPDGRTLNFPVVDVAPRSSVDVRYVVSIAPGARTGEAVNRVLASGSDGVTSNEAAAAVRIKALLFTSGFTVIGRVTEGACGDPVETRKGVPGIRLLMEDGTFVVTDRDGLYHFEGVRPGRHVVQLDSGALPASYEAVACGTDTRNTGSAISRFVESDGGLLKRVDFQLLATGKAASAATLPIAITSDATAAGNRDWATGQAPGIEMLFPAVDHNPRAPVLRVVIQHLPGQRVALTINGAPTDPLAFDATDVDGLVAISRWTGLPLTEGDNRLSARVLNADGSTATMLDRIVHSSSIAAEAAIVKEQSRLVADGITRPLIAVRVTDRTGRPVRAGTLLPFRVDQPYMAAIDPALDKAGTTGATGITDTIARVVGDDGLAFIALEPTTQAGAVNIVATLADDKTAHTRALSTWLSASAKDWIVVGFGSGTLGYKTLDRHDRALPLAERGKMQTDGQLALYAKGRIKGSWLATIAYDSDRPRDRDRGLLGTIDPDRYYTVYGDGTRQGYDAPTERKLYLRLEAPQFYALFGDYETGLTRTRLGRYSRTMNGAKVAYEGRRVTVTAFAADSDELYARDEIAGNGLSGPYRLSGRNIVPNSDKLRIEIRDRFRSEQIISSTPLVRHIDYDIDTIMGTIRFRAPVLTRDPNGNPIFIVVDYETDGRSRKLVAGGRAAIRSKDGRVEAGVTALHDAAASNATVIAADMQAKIGRTTEVRAEAATGGRGGIASGQAFLVEAEHHGTALDLVAYARQQDRGFGVGQQNVVEAGTRKLGVDGRLRIGDRLSLTGTAWHQDQLDSAGTRTAADVRIEMQRANGTVYAGGQIAMDRGIDGRDRTSRLLTLGGTQALLNGKLTLGGQTQIAPGGDKASVDFPIRHQLTAAYRLTLGVRLLGGYEIAQGRDFTARTAQVGFEVTPWTGGRVSSSINQQAMRENGARTFAQYGLTQSLSLGSRWMVDATLDASSTVRGSIPAGAVVNAFQPVASGGSLAQDGTNGDYAAITLGANYRADRWSWNGRVEYRTSDTSDRFNITTSLLRTLGEGKTIASQIRWSQVMQKSGAVASYAVADLSLAWRPLDSNWSVLERFELRRERADAGFNDSNLLGVAAYGGGFQASFRAINNLAVNYRTTPQGNGHGTEATLYYGAKWVKGSFGADDYAGYIDVVGFDIRRDVGRRFDIGVQASVQHAWTRKAFAFSVGPTIGVSPVKNLWFSAGYNIAGYRDRDFEADRYTQSGPFVTMRLKFDQSSIGRIGRATGGGR